MLEVAETTGQRAGRLASCANAPGAETYSSETVSSAPDANATNRVNH